MINEEYTDFDSGRSCKVQALPITLAWLFGCRPTICTFTRSVVHKSTCIL